MSNYCTFLADHITIVMDFLCLALLDAQNGFSVNIFESVSDLCHEITTYILDGPFVSMYST